LTNKNALVLGCSGQDGSLLSKSLLNKGYKVIGLARTKSNSVKNHIKLGIEKDVEIKLGDIQNSKTIEKIISDHQPDAIFNLAAQSSVGKSFYEPLDTIQGIVNGTLNILEVSRQMEYSGTIFFAGTSEMFGNTHIAADINHKHNPISPYAIAKQTSFNLVKFYREVHKLKCLTGVLFNHESHLRHENFVTQKIIKAVKNINKNNTQKLKLGNIEVIRDWGWAPEYIEAIQLITKSEKTKDHVICSGKTNSLKLFIQKTFSYYGLDWREHTVIDKSLFRPNEILKNYGNPDPLFVDTGWRANVDFDSLIHKLIDLS